MLEAWKPMLAACLIAGAGIPSMAWAQEGEPEEPAGETPSAEAQAAPEPPAEETKDPEAEALQRARKELEKLQTEYQLMQQRQKNALAQSELEKQEITTKAALREAKQNDELSALRAEAARLQAQADKLHAEQALREAQRKNELDGVQAQIQERQTNKQLTDLERAAALDEIKRQSDQLAAQNALLAQQLADAQTRVQLQQQELQEQVTEIQSKLTIRDARDKVKDKVIDEVQYRDEPFEDGTLYISDRRIPLNGPIWEGTADYVTERINFFNNQSTEYPIFIVIDDCPGGSVMEGYRIVKAIEASRAPVHVVVKSFAASMAAVITTLSDHSYAYPNAIILHHQMSSGMSGNLTQQKEQLENAMEWARRLADPVAKKMGVSYDEFVKQMYEHNSDGDWEEFADQAVKLHWINNVVNEIREDGIRDRPKSERWSLPFFFQMMKKDEHGAKYIPMPPLRPFDHYFIYDPNNFYRAE